MATLTLPVIDRALFKYRIVLGGTRYSLRFRYNSYGVGWYLDIYDEADTVMVVGNIRLAYGIDLLEQYQHLIKGSLTITEPKNGTGDAIARNDFVNGSPIIYDTEASDGGGALQERADGTLA